MGRCEVVLQVVEREVQHVSHPLRVYQARSIPLHFLFGSKKDASLCFCLLFGGDKGRYGRDTVQEGSDSTYLPVESIVGIVVHC